MSTKVIRGTATVVIAALCMQGLPCAAYAAEYPELEGTLGFARVEQEDACVNVRAEASTQDGEVIGILRNGDSAVIESVEEDGWYRIRSGDVEGYVASWLIATGEEAEEIAGQSAYTYAKVNAASLNIRAQESTDAEVIGILEEGDEAEVADIYDGGAFVSVVAGTNARGYVAADYVELVTEYPVGKTLEQLAQEETASAEAVGTYCEEEPPVYYAEEAPAEYDTGAMSEGSDASTADLSYQETAVSGQTDEWTESSAGTASDGQEAAGSQSWSETEAQQEIQTEAQTEAAVPAASATGSSIASYACQFVGIPYVWGGSSLTSGVDCSGFTMAVFSHFGISLPHFAASQYGCGTPVSLSDLAAGDLVFYNGSSGSIEHVAIYVGGGSIVHARGTGYGVCYSSLNYDTPDAACRVV